MNTNANPKTATPTPWYENYVPRRSNFDKSFQHWITFRSGSGIDTVHFKIAVVFGRTTQEAQANAKLVRASPELLTALKEAQRDLELDNKSAAIATIRAAIAKVEPT